MPFRSVIPPVLYMPGVYRIENGKHVFTILTREQAENISFSQT